MDQVQITIPCDFETTYASLQTGSHIMRCMMCDEEHIYIRDVLNWSCNSLRLREKHLELKIHKLQEMYDKFSTIKQDPSFCVEKSFERIGLEARRV